jgi:hypothetical protein
LSQQQGDGGEHGSTTGNYELRTTGSTGSVQEGGSRQEGLTFPNPYSAQNVYPPQHRVDPPSGFLNATTLYADQATLYGSNPNYRFSSALNPQPGLGSSYGAYPQPAPSGEQSHYDNHRQYEGQENIIRSPGFNSQLAPGENLLSRYPTQYSPAAEHMSDPASLYEQGSSWPTRNSDNYGSQPEQVRPTLFQKCNSAMTGENVPPVFPEQYPIPQGNIAPSGHQVNLALPPRKLDTETYSLSAEDGASESSAATSSDRKQPTYRDSYGARADSITAGSESERLRLTCNDPGSDATVEIADSKSGGQQRSQHQKST